jgi:hypothetical protein
MKHLLISFALITLCSCGGTGTDEADWYTETDATTATATFAEINELVLVPHCVRCHTDYTSAQNIAEIIVPGDPSTSRFITEVNSGQMPRGEPPLKASTIERIRSYIRSSEAAQYPAQKASHEGEDD